MLLLNNSIAIAVVDHLDDHVSDPGKKTAVKFGDLKFKIYIKGGRNPDHRHKNKNR